MAINNGYATLSQIKAAIGISQADTVDDSLLEMAVESASRQIDSYVERYFYNGGTSVKIFSPLDEVVCATEDFISLSLVETSEDGESWDTTWAATDWQAEPLNGRAGGLVTSYTQIRAIEDYLFPVRDGEATVRLTGVWGWSSVPIAITQATIILAGRIFKRLDSPLGIISGEMGSIRVGYRLDPDVQHLIEPYRKFRLA
jgi:hypothetical protein